MLAHLKRSIVEVKTNEKCLANAMFIDVDKAANVNDYPSYSKGRKILPKV